VSFPGYLAVLEDMAALGVKLGDPQEQEKEEEEGGALENFEVGDLVTLSESCAIQHFTEPPPRFSEGTIVSAFNLHP
jgi:DNA topoisomerase IA